MRTPLFLLVRFQLLAAFMLWGNIRRNVGIFRVRAGDFGGEPMGGCGEGGLHLT
jgi:hypothetical protein